MISLSAIYINNMYIHVYIGICNGYFTVRLWNRKFQEIASDFTISLNH